MKLISQGRTLAAHLERCISKYEKCAFAVAWASGQTTAFKRFSVLKRKIQHSVVGTHFFQTDPTVLETFVGDSCVRFVLQPSGVFHPKVYAFWTGPEWEIFIGSANFTAGGLGANTELTVHLTQEDDPSGHMLERVRTEVHSHWTMAQTASKQMTENYRNAWRLRRKSIDRLAGVYGGGATGKSPLESGVMTMSWPKFSTALQKDPSLDERLRLLSRIGSALRSAGSWENLDLQQRKMVAGLPGSGFDAGWFGSMKGAGDFHQIVNDNDRILNTALAEIPAEGEVTEGQYQAFVRGYARALEGKRSGLGTASRLLAMKRPDQFVCFNSKNKQRLCHDFGVKQSQTVDTYWDQIVLRIRDSVWWNAMEPDSRVDRQRWQARAALLDSMYYKD